MIQHECIHQPFESSNGQLQLHSTTILLDHVIPLDSNFLITRWQSSLTFKTFKGEMQVFFHIYLNPLQLKGSAPPEIVVWIEDIFENNFWIENDFTRYRWTCIWRTTVWQIFANDGRYAWSQFDAYQVFVICTRRILHMTDQFSWSHRVCHIQVHLDLNESCC